jgi:hypothetical protein
MRSRWLLGLALVLSMGCGGPRFASVSGKVTMNGKPLANALVSFNPIPKPGSSEAGPGSIASTDANGEYTLKLTPDRKGALVGKHRVAITAMSTQGGESDTRQKSGRQPLVNTIPGRYNEKSELTFEVPPDGTNQANFDLTSP